MYCVHATTDSTLFPPPVLCFPGPCTIHAVWCWRTRVAWNHAKQLLSLQRQLSLRTLGSFHIDERRSLTELRSILRDVLSEGLRKATEASIAEAARAAQEAAEAAAAAAQETRKNSICRRCRGARREHGLAFCWIECVWIGEPFLMPSWQ